MNTEDNTHKDRQLKSTNATTVDRNIGASDREGCIAYYLKVLRKYKLLSKSEEVVSARRISHAQEEIKKRMDTLGVVATYYQEYITELLRDSRGLGKEVKGKEKGSKASYIRMLQLSLPELVELHNAGSRAYREMKASACPGSDGNTAAGELRTHINKLCDLYKRIAFGSCVYESFMKKLKLLRERILRMRSTPRGKADGRAGADALSEIETRLWMPIDSFLALYQEIKDFFEEARAAGEQMILSNLRLVVSIAERQRREISLDDAVQAGNIGLIKAVYKYDYKRGCKFSTYATRWIQQAVSRASATYSRTIQLPVHISEQLSKFTQTRNELTQRYGYTPSPEEIAKECGTSPEQVRKVFAASAQTVSIYEPVGQVPELTLSDFIADHRAENPADAADRDLQWGKDAV